MPSRSKAVAPSGPSYFSPRAVAWKRPIITGSSVARCDAKSRTSHVLSGTGRFELFVCERLAKVLELLSVLDDGFDDLVGDGAHVLLLAVFESNTERS